LKIFQKLKDTSKYETYPEDDDMGEGERGFEYYICRSPIHPYLSAHRSR